MEVAVEHVALALVLIAVVLSLSAFVSSTVLPSVKHAEEHQLEPLVEAILDEIVYSYGYPPDWGSNVRISSEELESFGLAKLEGRPNELDLDKVLRLRDPAEYPLPDTLYVPPKRALELLGLDPLEYGMRLTVVPALNITVEVLEYREPIHGCHCPRAGFPESIAVSVSNYEGYPAPRANVTALYVLVYVERGESQYLANCTYTCEHALTDYRGEVELSFSEWLDEALGELKKCPKRLTYVIYVYAEYYGIRSANVVNEEEVLYVSAISNYLLVWFPIEVIPMGARHLGNFTVQVVPPAYLVETSMENVTRGESGYVINRGAFKFRVYELEFVDPRASEILLVVKWLGGEWVAVAADRIPLLVYQTGEPSGVKTAVVGKLVEIAGLTYYLEVVLWRTSE